MAQTSQSRSHSPYIPIQTSESTASHDPGITRYSDASFTTKLAIAVCFLSVIINTLLYMSALRSTTGSVKAVSYTRSQIESLRRPSQFIGLDKIVHSSTSASSKQFINYPLLLSQIDQLQPTKVFVADSKRALTSIGTISPEDRRVQITKTISTIVQFRALDFHMELCELQISIPPPSPSLLIFSEGKPLTVEIFSLDASYALEETKLCFQTRPQRVSSLGNVWLTYGVSWNYTFSCSMEDIYTFELAYSDTQPSSGSASELRWWQARDGQTPAFFMMQYSS